MESFLNGLMPALKNYGFGLLNSFNPLSMLGGDSWLMTIFNWFRNSDSDAGKQLNQTLDSVSTKAKELASGFAEQLHPDAALAKKTLDASIADDARWQPLTKYLDPKAIARLQSITADQQSFWEKGIPALDQDGDPAAAATLALAKRNELVAEMTGNNGEHRGPLRTKNPNLNSEQCKALADEIATVITGIPSDAADVASVLSLPPGTGLYPVLKQIQLTLNNSNFQQNSLKASDIAAPFDTASLSALAMPTVPDQVTKPLANSQPTEVSSHNPPPPVGKPSPAPLQLS